jgi:hypothetical protein
MSLPGLVRSVRSGPASRVLLAVIALCFCAAPVPGDVGGCGQDAALLDPPIFFASKKVIDCQNCENCGFSTNACRRACDDRVPIERAFPADCLPLVHDGEVCLRVLLHASCDDYAEYVSDVSPTVPTECNFCPKSVDQ